MKNQMKLLGTFSMLLAAMVMIVMTSYAWMAFSTSPTAEGIQIMIGGGSTILLAEDLVDENGNHYPGAFSDGLNITRITDLGALGTLQPVSTADGIHWYLPTYYTAEDEEVRSHLAYQGMVRPISEFIEDDALLYADNCTGEAVGNGEYLYLDFWIVAPERNYELHVSSSEERGKGSYVIGWQDVVQQGESYQLTGSTCDAEECIRVGFLVNKNTADAAAYAASADYESRYDQLRGVYQEPGEAWDALTYSLNTFTIYEPNGDSHRSIPSVEGRYVVTSPLGDQDGTVSRVNVSDKLCIQLKSQWDESLEGIFQAALIQAQNNGAAYSAGAVKEYLYQQYLQRQTSMYVRTGQFINDPGRLYASGVIAGGATVADPAEAETSGASITRIAALERNVPQRIRMFIWLEGQDVDCRGGTGRGQLSMNIELAGSSIK